MKKILHTATVFTTAISFSLFLFFGISSNAYALTISPARIELNADPGQTITGEFNLINEQEETKTFYSSAANFEAQGESGTPTFTDSKEGLASWVHLIPQLTLEKGQKSKVTFTIAVPKDADAGGHFAAIFLSTAPNATDKSQVSIGAKIGVLILLRVSGDIKEGGGITAFDTKDKTSFFTSLPVNFAYRFNNSGNDRVNPTGDIAITNTIGFETARLSANQTQGNVLPGSTRRFDVAWGSDSSSSVVPTGFFAMVGYEWNHFAFGRYTAHLVLAYGNKTATAEASKVVYVFPWQLLLVVLIILIILFFVFSQGLTRYNRWIIHKAQNMK
jgi:hypothetical protein